MVRCRGETNWGPHDATFCWEPTDNAQIDEIVALSDGHRTTIVSL